VVVARHRDAIARERRIHDHAVGSLVERRFQGAPTVGRAGSDQAANPEDARTWDSQRQDPIGAH
jgi:hypothetical protein